MARAHLEAGYTGIFVTDHFFNGNTAVPADLPWRERVERFCRELGISYEGHAGKPSARGFRRAMARVGVTPEETAMLGDKLLTDMLGANRAGVLPLMVEPLGGPQGAWNRILHLLQRPWKAAAREKCEEA